MGKEYNRSVGYRSRKRKFYGHKNKQKPEVLAGISASAKKLKPSVIIVYKESNNASEVSGYRFIDVGILFKKLSEFVSCKMCHSNVTFSEDLLRGCSSVFSVTCKNCMSIQKINSCRMVGYKNSVPEVNIRVVYGMRCIGQGLAGLKTFCSVMNMPQPITQKSYENINNKINCASYAVAEKVMKEAAAEETQIVESSDICVSGDGTWKTRGHTSKIGVCSVIGTETGKVLDVEVLSSFCKACETSPSSSHDCKRNHLGSSGSMEVIGMTRIFLRSEENRKVRYTKYLGDGDTKTYLQLTKEKPYGELEVEKMECIGHVQKRMGTRLRKLKQQLRGVKLPDEKSLGGKSRLTDSIIDKLTVYYGKAIMSNTHSLKSMREAVWATYCHMCSTDKEPMHMFCPKGADSWCKFQKHVAVAKNKDVEFIHPVSVPIEVMKCIKSVYTDLSAPNLLKRCLSGKTQNPNECFNSIVWKFCPKTSGSGMSIAKIAVYEAVITFNEGNCGRLKTLKELGLDPGFYTSKTAAIYDADRVNRAEKRASLQTLEARRKRRLQEKKKNEEFEQQEGITYKSGEF